MYYTQFNTKISTIILSGDKNGLKNLHLSTGYGGKTFSIKPDWEFKPDFFEDIENQLNKYFNGELTSFNIRLNPDGTEFQKRVWEQILKIPYGGLKTYSDIASSIQNKDGARAVGAACGKNPIPVIIPCHRVVGINGNLTGFAHGLEMKRRLIEIEK